MNNPLFTSRSLGTDPANLRIYNVDLFGGQGDMKSAISEVVFTNRKQRRQSRATDVRRIQERARRVYRIGHAPWQSNPCSTRLG